MDSLFVVLGLNLVLAIAVMATVWLVSLRLRDVSIVDIVWGAAGALMAVSAFVMANGAFPRRLLITGMTVIWGCRLAFHIGIRKKGKGEDFRYAAMRARRPGSFPRRSLITVFLFQAFLIWAISIPAQVAQVHDNPPNLTALDFLGLGLWLIGFGFEAVSDLQLRGFLKDPGNRGKVMDRGLWRFSRHPNYFGDSLVWWGIFLVAAATPMGWVTVFSPLLMTFFLMKVSGVPMLEEALAERRKGYREYMRRTSPFFPWPPRKKEKEASLTS
jgi:steroid 5-alpha reductase family enzyme